MFTTDVGENVCDDFSTGGGEVTAVRGRASAPYSDADSRRADTNPRIPTLTRTPPGVTIWRKPGKSTSTFAETMCSKLGGPNEVAAEDVARRSAETREVVKSMARDIGLWRNEL